MNARNAYSCQWIKVLRLLAVQALLDGRWDGLDLCAQLLLNTVPARKQHTMYHHVEPSLTTDSDLTYWSGYETRHLSLTQLQVQSLRVRNGFPDIYAFSTGKTTENVGGPRHRSTSTYRLSLSS